MTLCGLQSVSIVNLFATRIIVSVAVRKFRAIVVRIAARKLRAIAVSYTHLDVYKRQGLLCVPIYSLNSSGVAVSLSSSMLFRYFSILPSCLKILIALIGRMKIADIFIMPISFQLHV